MLNELFIIIIIIIFTMSVDLIKILKDHFFFLVKLKLWLYNYLTMLYENETNCTWKLVVRNKNIIFMYLGSLFLNMECDPRNLVVLIPYGTPCVYIFLQECELHDLAFSNTCL